MSPDLLSFLAEDGEVLIYRPRLRRLTGSVTSAIFLGRVVFWRHKMKRPFYKFREPPGKGHPAYKEGDSWAEELGFGTRELRSAIMATSGRVRPDHPRPDTFLWRWTTRDRLTFWDVNVAVLAKALEEVYFPNGQNDHYQKDEPAVTKWANRSPERISTTIRTNSTHSPVAAGDGKTRPAHSEAGELKTLRSSTGWLGQHPMRGCFPNPVPWRFCAAKASRMRARPAASSPSGRRWPPGARTPIPRPRSCGPAATGWPRQRKAISACRHGSHNSSLQRLRPYDFCPVGTQSGHDEV